MKFITLLLSALLLPFASMADDAELYDPAPPAGSSYVRFIHADAAKQELLPTISGKSVGAMAYPSISEYQVIKGGDHNISNGDKNETMNIGADHYYTIALLPAGKMSLHKDEQIKNPAKARIYFYNLSSQAEADLFAPDHGAAIVGKVVADKGDSREVNALKLALQVKAGEEVVKEFRDVQLRRRRGISFALTGKSGSFKAIMNENAIAK